MSERIQLDRANVIQEFKSKTTYAYPDIEEGEDTEHHKMKAKIQKEYKRSIKLVFKSELIARNKIATPWQFQWSHTAMEVQTENWMRSETLTI